MPYVRVVARYDTAEATMLCRWPFRSNLRHWSSVFSAYVNYESGIYMIIIMITIDIIIVIAKLLLLFLGFKPLPAFLMYAASMVVL